VHKKEIEQYAISEKEENFKTCFFCSDSREKDNVFKEFFHVYKQKRDRRKRIFNGFFPIQCDKKEKRKCM
jgi:hypothetical protein